MSVFGQRIDQFLPRLRIAVIADRLARGGIVVVAAQHRTQLASQAAASGLQQPANRRSDQDTP